VYFDSDAPKSMFALPAIHIQRQIPNLICHSRFFERGWLDSKKVSRNEKMIWRSAFETTREYLTLIPLGSMIKPIMWTRRR
jgi:hypothetical protein